MDTSEMKELVRHIMEDGFNRQDMAVVYESFHHDYVRHGYGVPSMGSLAEHVEDLKARHRDFDDAHFVIRHVLADGDMVAVHYAFKGVRNGQHVTRQSAAFFLIREGKVAHGTIVADALG